MIKKSIPILCFKLQTRFSGDMISLLVDITWNIYSILGCFLLWCIEQLFYFSINIFIYNWRAKLLILFNKEIGVDTLQWQYNFIEILLNFLDPFI